jgi:hypothetical protein
MVRECRANGRWIGPQLLSGAMPAHPRSGKIFLGSALLVYQCAYGDWFAIAHGAHDPSAACRLRPRDGFFISLLSRTPEGARLMLLCLP